MNRKEIWNQLDSDTQGLVKTIVSLFFPASGKLPHPPEINPDMSRQFDPTPICYTNMAKDADWRKK